MRSLPRKSLFVLLMTIAVSAPAAFAQVDVEMSFNPQEATAGDMVTFYSSISHLGTEPVDGTASLTIEIGGYVMGPFEHTVPLSAGLAKSKELEFTVPPLPMSYDISITLAVTAGESSDSTTATLSITAPEGGNPFPFPFKNELPASLRSLGEQIAASVRGDTVTTEDESFSQVKERYRR